MNRIDQKFKELKKKKKKAFIAFITAGDPNLKTTEELVLAFEQNGVDMVELGVPFSDPMADGPTIQASSQRALDNGTTLEKIFATVRRIRNRSQIPIVFMIYYNSIFHFGEKKFVESALACGVDGIVVPDLPFDEARTLIQEAKKKNFKTVFFVAPTSTKERIKLAGKFSTGFVYYVSLTGVTGERTQLPSDVIHNIRVAKQLTGKPVCAGFGISTPSQVRAISQIADGIIVGSAIVKVIEKNKQQKNLVRNVANFVRTLTHV